ncbi:hypothetical protein A8D69_35375 [Burkholderia cenocepacia]|nr:hypothetical protein A8D69_35375 [Burkholderia cenocepacia]
MKVMDRADAVTDVEVPARGNCAGQVGLCFAYRAFEVGLLPQQPDLESAVREAKTYLTGAIAASGHLDVGHGVGPVHHFHRWW